jgi:hypothetical protein
MGEERVFSLKEGKMMDQHILHDQRLDPRYIIRAKRRLHERSL